MNRTNAISPETIKERPIIFSAPMVRAILAGQKTQTRRVVAGFDITGPNPPFPPGLFDFHRRRGPGKGWCGAISAATGKGAVISECPYGVPGDRLWVVTIKDIEGYGDRYGAGDDGCIYRVDGPEPKRMRPGRTDKGYLTVTLCRNGTRTTRSVHDLVCRAFYGHPARPELEVRHLDGDRSNNHVENLDWGTRAQNRADRESLGRGSGEGHHSAKLTRAQVAEIRASAEPQRSMARRFGVSQATIWDAKKGGTWPDKSPAAPPPNMPRWASRITLELTEVRVQRLQEISEEDARAEGVLLPVARTSETHGAPLLCLTGDPSPTQFNPGSRAADWSQADYWRHAFAIRWNGINRKCGFAWDTNPFVWVLTFRRLA